MDRKRYPTDLTNEPWEILEPLVPPEKPGGRHRETDTREVVNAILDVNRTGCQWDMLPHDLLPKSTVYDDFARWRDDGTAATDDGHPSRAGEAPRRTRGDPPARASSTRSR